MTDHWKYQDYSSPSEELYPLLPGPYLSKSQEVDIWCQSVSSEPFHMPSPPDTVSDCFSDCQDMPSQAWNQTSLPENLWIPDRRQNIATSLSGRTNQSFASTLQSEQAIDGAYVCPELSQGSVASGLSPPLSHSGQSPRTLNSFSEPEFHVLPASLDLSYPMEANWPGTQAEIVMTQACVQPSASMRYVDAAFIPGRRETRLESSCMPWSQPDQRMVQEPYFPARGGQTGGFRQSLTQPVIHRRAILPRTEPVPASGRSGSDASQRTNDTHIRGQSMSARSASSVSSMPGQQAAFSYNGQRMSGSNVSGSLPVSYVPEGLSQSMSAMSMDAGLLPAPPAFMYQVSDPTMDDFSAFIQYDQEDNTAIHDSMSSNGIRVHRPLSALPRALHSAGPVQDAKPVLPKPDPVARSSSMDHEAAKGITTDGDEGRHRTHPLYSRGPAADGQYYCPFKDEPDANCGHKRTKLKCNYDKYIDSHLKPFRCKHAGCSKQQFSSTACLLRHEREAHGMHGHGDRPHLCCYKGCDRGAPGNGFPRKYNLLDHMKRVHDHKGDVQAAETSPVLAGAEKKAVGRKRRGSGSGSGTRPPAQRTRTTTQSSHMVPAPRQGVTAMPAGYAPRAPPTPPSMYAAVSGQHQLSQLAKDQLYAHWNNRRRHSPERWTY